MPLAFSSLSIAGFTNAATMKGDKVSTLHYMITLGMQHSMVWDGTGMMPLNTKAARRNDINISVHLPD